MIKSAALGLEIWEYINPATKKERLPKLEEPAWPTPSTVKEGATGISEPKAGIGVVVEGKKPKEVCEPCQLAAGLH